MISIQVFSGMDMASAMVTDPYCVVRFHGKEIGRTNPCSETPREPFWNSSIDVPFSTFEDKILENQRPFLFEHIAVELYNNTELNECVGSTRVKLVYVDQPEWYRVISKSGTLCGKVLVGIRKIEDTIDEDMEFRCPCVDESIGQPTKNFDGIMMMELSCLLPPCLPQYSQLYISDQTDCLSVLGFTTLPGPTVGEVVLDKYDTVEWKVATGNNLFGDKYYVTCEGSLYITDLRVIFIPSEILSPSWSGLPSIYPGQSAYTAEQVLLIRRTTYQMPLSAIQDCKVVSINVNSSSITFEARDNTVTDFIVFTDIVDTSSKDTINSWLSIGKSSSAKDSHRLSKDRFVSSRASVSKEKNSIHGVGKEEKPVSPLLLVSPSKASQVIHKLAEHLLANQHKRRYGADSKFNDIFLYNCGLQTVGVAPNVWCTRVRDEISWLITEGYTWVRWSKYLKLTCEGAGVRFDRNLSQSKPLFVDKKELLKKLKEPINIDTDFERLRVLEAHWSMSDVNVSYDICNTYPQTLVFPGSLSREDIVSGANQRSKGRMPALVWLHPQSHTPLCRCAQPVVGISGMPEHDKRVCMAIQKACTSGLPMRIADARPKLNAQANAMQGKGYENIAYYGGSSVASLTFLDIDNIHVMRSSIKKLRENNENGSYDTTSSASSSSNVQVNSDAITASKWLHHVSNLLRGSIGMAESLLIGHPVLVHCSDGWDRTAQLCALTELLIDPYYRTFEGFFLLIQKEFCSFGHKFEERLGNTNHKDTSPVFLQFLDAVYQVVIQFPTDFAFSTQFLVVLASACYSGFFSTFMENNEKDRYIYLKSVFASERMEPGDLEYSSLFCYMRVLLRSNLASTLTNPNYHIPRASQARIKYIRPRHYVSDLNLWREGLFGINQRNFKGFLPNSLAIQECNAISAFVASRYFDYISRHASELSKSTANQLSRLLNSGDFIVPSVPYSPATTSDWYKTSQYRYHSYINLPILVELNPIEVAAVNIQLWYKSRYCVEKACKNESIQGVSSFTKLLLKSLVWSELKLAHLHRLSVLCDVHNDMRSLVYDVVEESLTFAIRREAATARVIEYEQNALNNSVMVGGVSYVSGLFSSHAAQGRKTMSGLVNAATSQISTGYHDVLHNMDVSTAENVEKVVSTVADIEKKSMFSTLFSNITRPTSLSKESISEDGSKK